MMVIFQEDWKINCKDDHRLLDTTPEKERSRRLKWLGAKKYSIGKTLDLSLTKPIKSTMANSETSSTLRSTCNALTKSNWSKDSLTS
jgi:hypothetical protein